VPERDLRRKLFWLIAIRVCVSTLLLGSAVVVQLNSPDAAFDGLSVIDGSSTSNWRAMR
jgi:hypothetical protein